MSTVASVLEEIELGLITSSDTLAIAHELKVVRAALAMADKTIDRLNGEIHSLSAQLDAASHGIAAAEGELSELKDALRRNLESARPS